MADGRMKDFIVVGHQNAITYKEVFPLLKDNKVRLGYSKIKAFCTRTGTKDFGNVGWYTTLPVEKKTLTLTSTYDPDKYPKYDNYDAIDCGKVAEIPIDYDGIMGVPITYLFNYNPNQFEIVDARTCAYNDKQKNKSTYLIKDADGAINGKPTYARICIRRKVQFEIVGLDRYVEDNPHYGHRFTINGKETYARILIRKRNEKEDQE